MYLEQYEVALLYSVAKTWFVRQRHHWDTLSLLKEKKHGFIRNFHGFISNQCHWTNKYMLKVNNKKLEKGVTSVQS